MELVRHRAMSFAQESTRYCNYSKDKFGNEVTFILPHWFRLIHHGLIDKDRHFDANTFYRLPTQSAEESAFFGGLLSAEACYFILLEQGWKPQYARAVLPNALKTEVVMTGFKSDWDHFFELRCSEKAHPDMKKLADECRRTIEKQIKQENNGR